MSAPPLSRDPVTTGRRTTTPGSLATSDSSAPRRTRLVSPLLGLVLVLLALTAATLASFAIGARPIGLSTLVDAVTGFDPANGDHAVLAARVPRTVAGLLVGAALGLAGAAMQGVSRNPLADPGILGVNAGAALGVVVGIHVVGLATIGGYVWAAMLGAAAAAVVVYLVAGTGRGGATPVKLALAGAAVTAGLLSLTNGVLITSQQTFDSFRFWQVGALAGRDWSVVLPVLPFLLAGAVVTLGTGRVLNGLALGDDVARGLGQKVGLGRAVTALGVVVLCGAATALAGPIAFVGLVVPHAVRALVGVDYRWILPLSALVAPTLLLVADVVGRVVLPPGEVPAGVMAAVVGAPVFFWLVRRSRGVEL